MIGKSKGVQPVPNKNVAIWKFHLGFWRVRNHTERRFFSNFPMFVAGFLHLLQTVEHFEFWNNSGIEFIDIIILLHFLGNLFEGYFPQMCSFRHHIAQNYFPSSLFQIQPLIRNYPRCIIVQMFILLIPSFHHQLMSKRLHPSLLCTHICQSWEKCIFSNSEIPNKIGKAPAGDLMTRSPIQGSTNTIKSQQSSPDLSNGPIENPPFEESELFWS